MANLTPSHQAGLDSTEKTNDGTRTRNDSGEPGASAPGRALLLSPLFSGLRHRASGAVSALRV